MQILTLFKKAPPCRKTVAISFLPEGLALAISEYVSDSELKLIYAGFTPIQQNQNQQQQLDELVAHHELNNCNCCIVLAETDYRRVTIDAPNVAHTEMTGAIRWKIIEQFEFPVDTALIDYYPSPNVYNTNKDNRLEVVVCELAIANAHIEKCKSAGLAIKVIDIQETSLRNIAMLLSKNIGADALLRQINTSYEILIQKQASIYVYRKFESSLEQFSISTQFIDEDETPYSDIALEIQRSMDYAESYFDVPSSTLLAIIPFDENAQELVTVLKNVYRINAIEADLATLTTSGLLLDHATQSRCAAVIGASLRNQEYLQNINLYPGAANDQQPSVIAWYLSIALLIIVSLVIYSSYLTWNLRQLEAEVQQTRKLVSEQDARIKSVKPDAPKTEVNPELEKDIVQLQQAIQELNRIALPLSDINTMQTKGFSQFFKSLASQTTPDIWLTRIYFNAPQYNIRLDGSTLKPEQLPTFLQSLQQQAVFRGFSFASLLMQQSVTNSGQTDFILKSLLEKDDKK